MDQSVTIDGQRVLLNGEPVAEALGDFSVRVLAEAIVLHAQMQKELGDENGAFPVVHWLQHADTVVRLGVIPEEPTLAHVAWPAVNPTAAQQPKRVEPSRHSDALLAERIERNEPIQVLENPNLFKPTELLSAGWTRDQMLQYGRVPERYGLVPPENKNHRCSTLAGRIYVNSGGGYQPLGPDLGGNPPSQDDYTPRPTPAPADLIIKAREYYPDNEGLLRMYADCRGYSCDQVAEAIDHAKRL